MKNKNSISLLLLLLLEQPPYTAADHSEGHTALFSPITILLIIITVVLFLAGAIAVFLRRLSQGCLGFYSTPTAAASAGRPAVARGMDAATIRSIPTYLYSDVKLHRLENMGLECAVCLSEFEDTEELRLLPGCCHVFHPPCIDPWLAAHVTCPVCRQRLTEPGTSSDTLRLHTTVEIQRPTREESDGCDRAAEVDDQGVSGDLDYRSTGQYSLIDGERFRLKLPVEVHNRLVNRSENGSQSEPVVSSTTSAELNPVNGSKNLAQPPVRTSDRFWPI